MPSFGERIAAMKAQQEAAEKKKKEEVERAAVEQEKGERRGELAAERESVVAELAQAEQSANEAVSAIAQAEVFMAEQGENLAPEARAEIDVIKAEAAEATQKFEALKTELARIEIELVALEASAPEQAEAAPAETATEESVEVPNETPQEATVAAEAPQEAVATAEAKAMPAETSKEAAEKGIKELEKEASLLVSEALKKSKSIEATDFANIENPGVQLAELKQMREASLAKLNELIGAELTKEGPKKAGLVLSQINGAGVFLKLDDAINKLAQKANGIAKQEPTAKQLQLEYSGGETTEVLKMADWGMKIKKAAAPGHIDENDMVNGDLANLTDQMLGRVRGIGLMNQLSPDGVRVVKQKRDELVKRLMSVNNLKSEKELFGFSFVDQKAIDNLKSLDQWTKESERTASARRGNKTPDTATPN